MDERDLPAIVEQGQCIFAAGDKLDCKQTIREVAAHRFGNPQGAIASIIHQDAFGVEEGVAQIAQCVLVVNRLSRTRNPAGKQVVFLVKPFLKRGLWTVDLAEENDLAADLLAPASGRMRGQGNSLCGLAAW